MKISKLFHWLYAFLMALPVFALLPSVFYFAFNEHAQNYTYQSVTETYEYETNEVNSINDLVVGNIYKLQYVIDLDNEIRFSINTSKIYSYNNQLPYENTTNLYIYDGINYNISNYVVRITNSDNTQIYNLFPRINGNTINYYFIYETTNNLNSINFISASDYLGEKSVSITESEQSPTNIFYTAVDKVFETPLFEWSKTSLLVTPFQYISGLFGMPANSPITYYLSYWLAISIVYLVFDLVIYVPLLVHRWIDKGVVE